MVRRFDIKKWRKENRGRINGYHKKYAATYRAGRLEFQLYLNAMKFLMGE